MDLASEGGARVFLRICNKIIMFLNREECSDANNLGRETDEDRFLAGVMEVSNVTECGRLPRTYTRGELKYILESMRGNTIRLHLYS